MVVLLDLALTYTVSSWQIVANTCFLRAWFRGLIQKILVCQDKTLFSNALTTFWVLKSCLSWIWEELWTHLWSWILDPSTRLNLHWLLHIGCIIIIGWALFEDVQIAAISVKKQQTNKSTQTQRFGWLFLNTWESWCNLIDSCPCLYPTIETRRTAPGWIDPLECGDSFLSLKLQLRYYTSRMKIKVLSLKRDGLYGLITHEQYHCFCSWNNSGYALVILLK